MLGWRALLATEKLVRAAGKLKIRNFHAVAWLELESATRLRECERVLSLNGAGSGRRLRGMIAGSCARRPSSFLDLLPASVIYEIRARTHE